MVSQQMLISVALPVAAMAIVVGSVANVQDQTLAPGLDTLEAATSFGYPEVTIGKGSTTEDLAEKQLRGLTVFNMLSAQNCVYAAMVYHRKGEAKKKDIDLKGQYKPLEMNQDIGNKSITSLGQSQFTYFGYGDVLRKALALKGFNGVCLGGKQISITESLAKQIDSYKTYLKIEGAWEFATQPWNYGQGQSADNKALNRGALQGRYGRIEFKTHEPIVIENQRLMGMHLNDRLTDAGIGRAKVPDFVRGSRAAVFFPEGLLIDEQAVNAWTEGRDPGVISEGAIQSVAAAGGAAAGAAVGTSATAVLAGAALVFSGPVGWVVLAGAAGTAGLMWWGSEAAGSLAKAVDIGTHPGILLGIDANADPSEQSRNKDYYTGSGMFDYHEKDNMGWREDMNAFRVRMVNIPIVMGPGFYENDLEEWNEASKQLGYNYIVKSSQYVICNGTRGFIQSNAGADIENSGKVKQQSKNPIPRDVVYPRIEATSYNPGCLGGASWGGSNYYSMGQFKAHTEFLKDGSFTDPISKPLGFAVHEPLRKMLNEDPSDTDFEKTIDENALLLEPNTAVDLKQGIERVSVDEADYWKPPSNDVFAPTYRVSPQQCRKYDRKYDVTRMFSDESNSFMFAKTLQKVDKENGGDGEIEPYSYEIVKDGKDHDIKVFSLSGNLGNVPLTYNFDRFSADRMRINFSLDITNMEGLRSDAWQNNAHTSKPLVGFYFDEVKGEKKAFSWTAISLQKIATGASRIDGKIDNKRSHIDFIHDSKNIKSIFMLDKLQNVGAKYSQDYDGEAPIPVERKYSITIERDAENPKMVMKMRVWKNSDEGEPHWKWYKLFETSFQNKELDVNDITRMEIRSRWPPDQQGSHEARTTVEEVMVKGTITGCPQYDPAKNQHTKAGGGTRGNM